MKFSRRQLGQAFLAMVMAGIGSWRGLAVCSAIEMYRYPGLTRLAPLCSNDAACQRIASALSPSAMGELISSGIARADQNAAQAFFTRQNADRQTLDALLADDFRSGRTVQVGRFLLAETEAALVLLRRIAG